MESMSVMKTGRIFNIERFATKDGPGIRTLVFLKGCHLRCKWCANPESQNYEKEILYYANKCKSCGRCIETCDYGAIKTDENFGLVIDPKLCKVCGKCVESCFYGARQLMGEDMTVSKLMDIIVKDIPYYRDSGGGVTFSGGEPFIQVGFMKEVAKACRVERIPVAVESCGYVTWERIETVLPYLDLVFFDMKHIDGGLHKGFTGVDNGLILENLKKLDAKFSNIIVRIPVIPGYNDSIDVQRRMYEFVRPLDNVKRIELLPYHRLGTTKYKGLSRPYELEGIKPLKPGELEHLKRLADDVGVKVQIGPA